MEQDAKPRTAVASRHGQRRGGASREARRPNIAPYRNGSVWRWGAATGHGRGNGHGDARFVSICHNTRANGYSPFIRNISIGCS